MSSKSDSSISIGSIGGSIQNSIISTGTVSGSSISGDASVGAPTDVKQVLDEVKAALAELLPRIAAELAPVSPGAAQIGAAALDTIEAASAEVKPEMNGAGAAATGSKLEQAKSLLDMLLKGAQALPEGVAKASDKAATLVSSLTDLGVKVGLAVTWLSHLAPR